MNISNLHIGSVDAKNELIDESPTSKQQFYDSFLVPENIVVDKFLNGQQFFILGLKGTGKTALLRYIAIEAEKKNFKTHFVLFKTNFTEEDRDTFKRAAYTVANTSEINSDEVGDDYVSIWQWFFHREIVKFIKENKDYHIFEDDNNLEKYIACVSAPKLGDEKSGIKKWLPKIKRGNIEIEAGMKEFITGKIGLDLEWTDDNKVMFSSIVRQSDELFKRLKPSTGKFYLMIDELELSLTKQKQYRRDIALIRDLVIAVSNLNKLSRSQNFGTFLITSLRSEVLNSVSSTGKEINKDTTDFGINLYWHYSFRNQKEHPLMNILYKKIQLSERLNNVQVSANSDEVLARYFVSHVQNKSVFEYILLQTWYRPRDIVRLLTIAQKLFPNNSQFSHDVFDAIRRQYAQDTWIEITEELKAKFTNEQIEGIKLILTGVKVPFTLAEIVMEAEQKKGLYNEVETLLNENKLPSILSILYNLGIIGNTGEKVRFAFRGDDSLLLTKSMKIHDALGNYFSVEYR